MKRHINIQVNPVDNGYTITGGSHEVPSGQDQRAISAIAKDENDVKKQVAEYLERCFVPAPTKPQP